jgi:hypothetical protein
MDQKARSMNEQANKGSEPKNRPTQKNGTTSDNKVTPQEPRNEDYIYDPDAENKRIKIIHDPKSDNHDLDAYTERVNDPDPDVGQAPPARPEKF